LKEAEPAVELVYVRDYSIAFSMLKEGKVDAFPTHESVLRAIVKQDGHPGDYVFLSDFTKSRNVGFALKKGEPRFRDAVNHALLEIEASGEAEKIFAAWFGPQSAESMERKFKIRAD
jgi:polar amino acid transport system substrate-binding protein